MIRKNYFVITFNFFVTKIIAWLVLSCMILSSIFVLNKDIDNKVLESINSVENIFVQFFNISSMPADLISKMFVQNTETKLTNTPLKQEQNKAHENSTNDSSKYSIVPSFVKVINSTNLKNTTKVTNTLVLLSGVSITKQFMYESCFVDTLCRSAYINLILMMLLLAILLSQKNLGEEGISNINIKNKYKAQFA